MKKGRIFFKLTVTVMVLVLLSLSFVGCSSSNQPASSGPLNNVKEIKLTYAAPHTPPQTYGNVDVAFMEHMDKVSGGKIKFQYYPGGSLIGGTESAAELAKGVADYGWPRPANSPNGYVLYNALMMFMFNMDPINDVKGELEIYKKVHEKYPELYKEYVGIFPYAANAGGTSAYIFSKKPFKTLADLKGKIIRASGSWASVVKALGAQPVNMPIADTYLALEKGTVDATLGLPITSLKADRLGEVCKYVADIKLNMSPYYSNAFNKAKWDSLPKEVQQVFLNEQKWLEEKIVATVVSEVEPVKQYAKEQKIEIVEFSESDLKTLKDAMDGINRETTSALDKKGYKATEIYEYFQQLIKEYYANKKK